ncbi:MAG: hypothetical protein E7630_03200 [Ruminococcaceae bacterium]|nr:hypothetical protein [Oscillospiraceae bacterium]
MKRDFLEKLGLSKATIDAIMTEHGKSTEEYRNRCLAAEEELTALREAAEAANSQKESLMQTLAEQTAEAEAFRDRVILSLVEEAGPSSSMAKTALCRRLTEEALMGKDPREVLLQLEESDPDAFRKDGVLRPYFSTGSQGAVEDFPTLSSALKRR